MNEVAQTPIFYLHHENQQIGPFTIPAIQEMVKAGSITTATFAWREGLPDWIPLKDLAEYQQQTMVIPATLPNLKASNTAPSIAGTPADWTTSRTVSGNPVLSVVGGLAGAVIGAFIWSGVAIATDFSIGFIAIGVGWLAGSGTLLVGKKKGDLAQLIAAFTGFLGVVLGKYLIVCYYLSKETGGTWLGSAVTPEFMRLFISNIGRFSRLFDILWYSLAISAAWKIPAE